ncbi:hypothetical protein CQW49_13225 [Methylosinus trichosporium OB3b]|uniref:Lipoprotein n=2 Tax=Methylocystaceae TaxID=31993 RepID=A0A2D2D1A2_METT3|nr:hypothetical protein CQW49_13225 [Methylosinus trichosporium OB3b]OBS53105.1 hypothetical protein A8B73_07290 [Methylosinus sp. 3S-1]
MKIKHAAALLAIVAVSACKSAAERAQEAAEERAKVIAGAKDVCANFGHVPGTPAFSTCVERTFFEVVQAEQQEMNRAVAIANANRSVMCNRIGSTTICN